MKLWVGLGNPSAQYAGNRHNIGFMALDRIAADHGFSPWRARFQAQVAEGRLGGEKLMLIKPQTFMNRSGQAVGEAARFFKLGAEALTVFHDELDLAPGKCRLKQGGGHAGHNGLRSIIAHLDESFARVRLGIGHPGRKDLVSGYVLHDFAKADADWLDDLMRGISDGAPALAAGEGARFLNAVAARTTPARNTGQARQGDRPATTATAAPQTGGQKGGQTAGKPPQGRRPPPRRRRRKTTPARLCKG
ncbi:MAG: aminoacyl-tRNA hydrolase [Pararhodobacter sp.]